MVDNVNEPVGARAAAFFDLDKTIIASSSALAFSRHFYDGGLINRRAVLRGAYAQLVFRTGGADHDQIERLRAALCAQVAGWPVHQVSEIVAETLHTVVDPVVYAEAADLIDVHHAGGLDVVIVSTSGAEIVEPIGEMLGADRVVATRMRVDDGRYTGEIADYVYGPAKAEAVRRLAADLGYDLAECYAYSDSATDLPMLEAVGHPHAVNPDRALRREAAARGWPVLDFDHPVPLRRRIAARRGSHVAAAFGAGVVGLAWYASRRRVRVDPSAPLPFRPRVEYEGRQRLSRRLRSARRTAR